MFDTAHRADALRYLLSQKYTGSIETAAEIDCLRLSCDKAILHILQGDDLPGAIHTLKLSADWFEYPHPPEGRDPQGEVDFIAIRIICALFEPACYEKMPQDVRDSFFNFFTWNFKIKSVIC